MMIMMFLPTKRVTKLNLDQESAGPWLHMAWLSQRGDSLWSLHHHHHHGDDDGDDDDGFSLVIGNVNFAFLHF